MSEYKEVRKLDGSCVSELCISNNWYTRGNCQDYNRLLKFCDSLKNVSTNDIVEIAKDIIEHSYLTLDYRFNEHFENICFLLFKKCDTFIEGI